MPRYEFPLPGPYFTPCLRTVDPPGVVPVAFPRSLLANLDHDPALGLPRLEAEAVCIYVAASAPRGSELVLVPGGPFDVTPASVPAPGFKTGGQMLRHHVPHADALFATVYSAWAETPDASVQVHTAHRIPAGWAVEGLTSLDADLFDLPGMATTAGFGFTPSQALGRLEGACLYRAADHVRTGARLTQNALAAGRLAVHGVGEWGLRWEPGHTYHLDGRTGKGAHRVPVEAEAKAAAAGAEDGAGR